LNKQFSKYLLQLLTGLAIWMLSVNDINAQETDTCIFSLGSKSFKKNNTKLTDLIKKSLDTTIMIINKSPNRPVKVIASDKVSCDGLDRDGQRSWDRVNSIVGYLVKKGVSENRVIFEYSGVIEQNRVDIVLGSNEELQLIWQSYPKNLRQNNAPE
jgi:hypothetical protein